MLLYSAKWINLVKITDEISCNVYSKSISGITRARSQHATRNMEDESGKHGCAMLLVYIL